MCKDCLNGADGLTCICSAIDDYCDDCGRSPCDGVHGSASRQRKNEELREQREENVQQSVDIILSFGTNHAIEVILKLMANPRIRQAVLENLTTK